MAERITATGGGGGGRDEGVGVPVQDSLQPGSDL